MKKLILGFVIISLIGLTGCSMDVSSMFKNISQDKINLTVAATTSLKKPLGEIKTAFENNNSNITLDIKYNKSQELTTSIIEGDLTDFVILSSQKNMNELINQNLVDKASNEVLAYNSLVLVTTTDSEITSVTDLNSRNVYSIAMGDPKKTSSGRIAKNTLEKMDLYDSIESKISTDDSVKDVLSNVKNGNAQVGIVFKTDAYNVKGFKIVYEFPKENYDSIVYTMAVSSGSTNGDKVTEFETFLKTEPAQKILANYGFTTTVEPDPIPQEETTEDDSSKTEDDSGGQVLEQDTLEDGSASSQE